MVYRFWSDGTKEEMDVSATVISQPPIFDLSRSWNTWFKDDYGWSWRIEWLTGAIERYNFSDSSLPRSEETDESYRYTSTPLAKFNSTRTRLTVFYSRSMLSIYSYTLLVLFLSFDVFSLVPGDTSTHTDKRKMLGRCKILFKKACQCLHDMCRCQIIDTPYPYSSELSIIFRYYRFFNGIGVSMRIQFIDTYREPYR